MVLCHYNGFKLSDVMFNGDRAFFKFLRAYMIIKEICKNKNIPFYWHSWSVNITKLSDDIKRIYFDEKEILNNDQTEILYELTISDKARDNRHLSKDYNETLARFFYEKHLKQNT
jgi:hypothetical protein